MIEQLDAAAAPKLAIDLPSGLDCDTGQPARHTIRAAETCTFVAAKAGFFTPVPPPTSAGCTFSTSAPPGTDRANRSVARCHLIPCMADIEMFVIY